MVSARAVNQVKGAETRRTPHARMWLNAGAVTLGVGAAMVTGAAVASADAGADAGPSSSHSASTAARAHASSSVKSASARRVSAKSARSSASIARITVPATPAPAATARHIPGATALAAASTTAVANTQPVALATPTPNKLLQGLAEFGHNVFLTVKDQFSGAKANLSTLGEDLRTVLGFSRVTITAPESYGDPAQTKQFYAPMVDYGTAPLATVAMAYAQLTNTEPDVSGFITTAMETPSLAVPGYKVYGGPGDYVLPSDSYEVLQDKNIRIITRYYYDDQQSKAINDLADGLQDPTKVMIAQITGPVDGRPDPGWKTVIVLGLDTTHNIVTINDPTQAAGKGLEMEIDDFVKQWGAQNFQLVTTQLAASSSTPLPAPATKLVWALPAPNEIGKNLAQLVVHQIEGLQSNLGRLADDLGYTFGIKSANIAPPSPQSVEYGNYTRNYPYYVYQGTYPTCLIMATAAIIGQLRGGPMPADLGQELLDEAVSTPSGVYPDEMIFEPDGTGKKGEPHWGTASVDAVKLLNMNGVNADLTRYVGNQGTLALETMTNALSQNQGVIVTLASNVVQNAYTRKYFGKDWKKPDDGGVKADHAVVVISVDATKEVVYINDSAWENGQGLPIPLDQFMTAWEFSKYTLITAEKRT